MRFTRSRSSAGTKDLSARDSLLEAHVARLAG